MFSLALAARFMRHATTLRESFAGHRGTSITNQMERLALRYERAADYLHDRFRRKEKPCERDD